MQNRKLHRATTILATLTLAGAGLTACSDSASESPNAAGDSDASNVLATTSVWADVAAAVTGNDVEAVISGANIDPHHFEPSAKDLARVREAGTLVANGGPYDASLYTVAEQDRIISAIPLVSKEEAEAHDHEHDHGHDHDALPSDPNELEHSWFSPTKVKEVAAKVQEKVGGSTEDVDKRMDAVSEKLASVPHIHVGMTEPIAAPLIWGTEIHDITPEGYLKATLNESEPSVQDVAALLDQIKNGHIDILIVNPQSTNSATEQLANAAKENDVPVVEMRETPPEGVNFLDYFEQVVDELMATIEALPQDDEHGHDHGEHAA